MDPADELYFNQSNDQVRRRINPLPAITYVTPSSRFFQQSMTKKQPLKKENQGSSVRRYLGNETV